MPTWGWLQEPGRNVRSPAAALQSHKRNTHQNPPSPHATQCTTAGALCQQYVKQEKNFYLTNSSVRDILGFGGVA